MKPTKAAPRLRPKRRKGGVVKGHFKITWLALIATLGTIGPAFGAIYEVTVSADFVKTLSSSSVFGITTAQEPVVITFEIDDSAATVLTAGDPVSSGDPAVLSHDVTFIPRAAILSSSIVVGSVTWNTSDMLEEDYGDLVEPAVLFLKGNLFAGASAVIGVNLAVQSASGTFTVGSLECLGIVCAYSNSGQGSDAYGAGYFQNVSASVIALTLNPVERISDLQLLAEAALGNDAAILDTVIAKLETKDGDHPAAKNKLESFIKQVEAKRAKLGDAQTDALITAAQSIINSL